MENTVYLIDYENVSYKGLYGISEVKPEDEIIIFYSNDISIIQDIISSYVKQGITIKYFELDKTGKNALDFMVSAYAGYAASKENVRKIAILSNDKGYTSIIKVIEKINPNTELVFECCIHNVNHPDDKKDILLPTQSANKTSDCNIKEEPIFSNPNVLIEPSDFKKNITADFVKDYLNKHTTIPSKYKTSVAGIIAKSVKDNVLESKVASALSKQLGTKSANSLFRKEALECFNKLNSM